MMTQETRKQFNREILLDALEDAKRRELQASADMRTDDNAAFQKAYAEYAEALRDIDVALTQLEEGE